MHKASWLLLLLWLSCGLYPVYCTLQVLSVSSFVPCVSGSVSTGGGGLTTLNCTNSGRTTLVDVLLTSSVQASILQNGSEVVSDQAGVFYANLTVVPPDVTGQSQDGSLAQCQTTEGQACQTTVPVRITIETLPPVYTYRLQEISSNTLPALRSAWGWLYGGVVVSDINPILKGKVKTNSSQCRLIRSTGMSSLQTSYPTGMQDKLDALFENATLNAINLKCPRINSDTPTPLAEAPVGIGLAGSGRIRYTFSCHALVDHALTETDFTLDIYAQGVPVAPPSRIFSIVSTGAVATAVRINATALANFTDLGITEGQVETLTLTTRQNGLVGSTGTSTPYGLLSASIIDIITPSGSQGPVFTGYVVTTTRDGLRYLNMTPNADLANPLTIDSTGVAAPLLSPSLANPWLYDPDPGAPFGRGKLPIPSSMRFMTGNDTHGMFYFLNNSQLAGVTDECTGMCVNPNILKNPPTVLTFAGAVGGQRNVEYSLQDILPFQNATDFLEDPSSWQGNLGQFLTCFPSHGLTILDVDVTLPCKAASDQQQAEIEIAALLANGSNAALNQIRRMRIPHQPPEYDPLRPNLWIYNNELYYQPTNGRGQSTGNIRLEAVISFSGDFAGYAQRVPAGQLQLQTDNPDTGPNQSPTTYCSAAWSASAPQTIQGQVSYLACNPTNSTQQSASYSVRSRCGLNSLFVPDGQGQGGGSYGTGPDPLNRTLAVLNTPPEANLIGVRPGQCKSAADGGFLYFDGAFTVDGGQQQPTLGDLQEAAGISCVVELYSTQSLVPSTVLLSREQIICGIAEFAGTGAPPFVVPSPRTVPTLAAITVTPSMTPLLVATATPKYEAAFGKAVGYGVIGFIILAAVVCLILALIVYCSKP